MEILRYNDYINESKDPNSDYSYEFSLLENEYLKLKGEGLTEEKINENIFGSIFGMLGGGFSDTFKDYIIDWAAEKLGIYQLDEQGKPTFFYQLLRNVFEQVHYTELGSYFGKGSCKNWARAIIEGLAETMEERGLEYLLQRLGVSIDLNKGIGGSIGASIREALTNRINDTEFINSIESMIGDKVCNFSLGDILKGQKVNTIDKEKMATDIEKAGEKDPDIFTKLTRGGLSNLIPNI